MLLGQEQAQSETSIKNSEKEVQNYETVDKNNTLLTAVGECFQQTIQAALYAINGAAHRRQLQLLQGVT